MSGTLSGTLASSAIAEQRDALRFLLRQPLVSRAQNEAMFVLIVRHRRWLTQWYSKHVRWNLEVDNASGFARLHKVPARSDGSRPARLASSKPPFTRRRYVLLCLALAAVDGCSAQTTLASLAELVAARSEDDAGIETFDPDVYNERRAFVDALKWMTDARVLILRDGDIDRYATSGAKSGAGDALYDINDRLLKQLISAPNPPALMSDRAHLLREPYAETDDGQRQRARHAVLRRLLDDPVVYLDDLTQSQRDWLEPSRSFVYRLLGEEAGMVVERRSEGLAAIDAAGSVTDILFPDGASTVKHAALLLGEHFVAQTRALATGTLQFHAAVFSDEKVIRIVSGLIDSFAKTCGWKKEYVDAEEGAERADEQGAERLANHALELLECFGLVRRVEGGWQPRPALARFAPMAPDVAQLNANAPEWRTA